MNAQTDQELLRDYAASQLDPAFAELVRRHLDLVYSAALRMVCDSHLAEDVTQGVFVALAQNAQQVANHPVLSGWLHRTTQNLAANAVRANVRRQTREQEAVLMNELTAAEPDVTWEYIAPHLDAALGDLSEPDRDAVLLRYFERKSAREIAETLGVSDEAAQKRVTRAVERLREIFTRRGITVGAGGLVVVISANAVQAAPVGLALTISTAAAIAGTTGVVTATATATKTIAMTLLQKTVVTATVAVLAGASVYEAHQATQLRRQNQILQEQQAEQIQKLQTERDEATSRLTALNADADRLNRNNTELLKLRGDVGVLRKQLAEAKQVQARASMTPTISQYPADAAEQQKRMQVGKMVDGRNYAMQLFMFADKNQGSLPTNWSQLADYAKAYPASGTNDFEFVHKQPINLHALGTNISATAVVREYTAWQTYDGKWRKVYGFADGHSEVVEVPDGNFTGWEEQNTYSPETVAK